MYELIEEMLNNLFASRLKIVNSKHLSVWVREIIDRKYSEQAIKTAEKELLNDDTTPLTIASVCKVINQQNLNIKNALPFNTNCKFCDGSQLAHFVLKFDLDGFLLSNNYALRCICSSRNTDLLQLKTNPENNKTYGKECYFKAFENFEDFFNYEKMVLKNGSRDLN